eukprot:s5136_g2.t1
MAFLRLRLSRDPLWSHFPRPGPSSPVDLEDDVQPKKRQALDTAERLGIPPGQFHGQFKGDQDICPCSSKEVSVASYFQARGIPADLADAVAAACDVKRLRRSQIRDLAHALARRPELRDELVAGELSVETFVGKSSDDLTSEAQRCRRSFEAAEALRAATRRGAEETFRLTCDECSGEAQGSWILSSSGGKPMLGAARMVKRGECTACGHIWLDEGR